MNDDLDDFEQFMKQREQAARAYVRGDAVPLGRMTARTSPATFFSPWGDYCQGAEDVWSRYERDAAAFEPGSDSSFEILHMAAGDGIAYWVGFQRATARMRGSPTPVQFNLRVTEVFRREAGQWKMIHRHADELKSGPGDKQQ